MPAASAAIVVQLVPTLPVPDLDEGSRDVALERDAHAPIPLSERKCPGVLSRQALALQEVRRMYPVMGGNYEKVPGEDCNCRGLFKMDCRTDGR